MKGDAGRLPSRITALHKHDVAAFDPKRPELWQRYHWWWHAQGDQPHAVPVKPFRSTAKTGHTDVKLKS